MKAKAGILTEVAPSKQPVDTSNASSQKGLDWFNFFLADAAATLSPFLVVFLASQQWDEQLIGMALAIGGFSGLITQMLIGALLEKMPYKRALLAFSVIVLGICSVMLVLFPSFAVVMAAQTLIGAASCVFRPIICAISFSLVSPELSDARQGRNQMFNSAGNVVTAFVIGALGYCVSNESVFFFVALLCVPTALTLFLIDSNEIENRQEKKEKGSSSTGWREMLCNRTLILFFICAGCYHFANAAMLPLVGEMLSKAEDRNLMMFMSACVITTQLLMTLVSSWSSQKAGSWGRKPLLLLSLSLLPLRGFLYTCTGNMQLLIALQILDGISMGIFCVVSVLVIADLTGGKGAFNIAFGLMNTFIGIGAILSQIFASTVVKYYGYEAGFLALTTVAFIALSLLYFFMPETEKQASSKKQPCVA